VRQLPASQVLAGSPGVLYRLMATVCEGLGFAGLGDSVFRDVVVARVVEPTRLFGVDRMPGQPFATLSSCKCALKRRVAGNCRRRLAGRSMRASFMPRESRLGRCRTDLCVSMERRRLSFAHGTSPLWRSDGLCRVG